MHKLLTWMEVHDLSDDEVAEMVGVSRVQISRIKRGKSKASVDVADKLGALTGIPPWEFVKPDRRSDIDRFESEPGVRRFSMGPFYGRISAGADALSLAKNQVQPAQPAALSLMGDRP